MININKKYRTRDGQEVRIYATDGTGSHPVHGAVKISIGWISCCWMQEGFHMVNGGSYDLIEVKPRVKKTMWLSLYRNGAVLFCTENSKVGDDCLARVKVEIDVEEGEGL
jgi:hypothetical protein